MTRAELDQQMRDVLAQLEVCSHVPAAGYQPTGRSPSSDEPQGGRRPPGDTGATPYAQRYGSPFHEPSKRHPGARTDREREAAMDKRRICSLHGPHPTGRMMYGPAPYGYGPVCRVCRRTWSRRNGEPWESADQARARQQAEHAAVVAEVEGMPPARFYVEWEALRSKRHEATRRYHGEAKPDEFGVNHFGSATPDGYRYTAMRARVLRERRAFEEAKDAV